MYYNRIMKKTFIGIICLALIFGTYFFFIYKTPITNKNSTGQTIVAFGDSLVYGTGSTQGNDFVSLVSNELGEPIINLGVPGNTSASGLARIEEVIALKPKIVIVLFGGNDFLQKIPIDTTFQNIDEIVTRIHNTGSAVILLGVRGGLLTDPYADRFEEIAKNRNTAYVPNILSGLIGNTSRMSDAIHPNDTGYKIIADKVLTVFTKEF